MKNSSLHNAREEMMLPHVCCFVQDDVGLLLPPATSHSLCRKGYDVNLALVQCRSARSSVETKFQIPNHPPVTAEELSLSLLPLPNLKNWSSTADKPILLIRHKKTRRTRGKTLEDARF